MAGLLGNPSAPGMFGGLLGNPDQMPQVPFRQNPVVTAIGSSLLAGPGMSGRYDMSSVGPALVAKTAMQGGMQKQKDAAAQKARVSEAWNAVIRAKSTGQPPPPEAMSVLVESNPAIAGKYFEGMMPSNEETFSVVSPEEVSSMGLPPGSYQRSNLSHKISQVGGGGTKVSLNMGGLPLPDPDPGYMWALKQGADGQWGPDLGPEGRPYQVPKTGGKLEAEAAAGEGQNDIKQGSRAAQAGTMQDATTSILELLDQPHNLPITGTLSDQAARLTSTPAGKVRSYVNTLKSGVVRDTMLKLKEASATGATGFGSMNGSELQVLIDAYGSLDPDTTDEAIFRKSIERIDVQQKLVIADIKRNLSPEKYKELGLEQVIGPQDEIPNMGGDSDAPWTDIGDGVKIRAIP